MPDAPQTKSRPHPAKTPGGRSIEILRATTRATTRVAYAEVSCISNFTFLTGASHPDELVVRAAELGHKAVGIADVNTLAGVVRGHVAAETIGLRFVVGCRIVLEDDTTVIVYPTDVTSYGRLCRLLTIGKLRCMDGGCSLGFADLDLHADGLIGVFVPTGNSTDEPRLRRLQSIFTGNTLSIAAACGYGSNDRARLRRTADLAEHLRVPMLATNAVAYHDPSRRMLHDAIACIHRGCTIDAAGYRLAANGEGHLKPPEEMGRLFADYPKALHRGLELVEQTSGFNLRQLKYQYPDEVVPANQSAMQHLTALARAGLRQRFPKQVPDHVRTQFEHELVLIDELRIAHYFLTVEDLVRWSREQGILCQGRGAAANSIVCYALGVTDADPRRINTLFERFVSRERQEPPDIDIDFEHERREEAIQYLYRKYGRDRAALTANVITYRSRLATREIGKVLGFSPDAIDRLAKGIDWWKGEPIDNDALGALKLDPHHRAIGHLINLTTQIKGFPRHLSQHPGGFVLTQSPLCELVPIEHAAMPDRTRIEWDKDDIDALGFIKVDVLGLGMLTCLAKSYDLLKEHRGIDLSVASTPEQDEPTYEMIRDADTTGVFQIESRAQMSMLPRLKPRTYYDLVIEVAIVRPGPIQGGMVHPYLRRRSDEEPVVYPTKVIEQLLGKTLGVPLFQEQAMLMAIHCAGFTPDEADKLRRAVTGFRRFGDIDDFERKIIDGMTDRGYYRDFAERCFKQIQGFSTYGFPESHAASFALLAYASSYLKCHHPSVFLAAILNSQPMGFYRPAQLVQDAQRHGVVVRPVCALNSAWDCSLEPCAESVEGQAVRLGMRFVKSMREEDAELIVARREGCGSIQSLWRRTGCSARSLRVLATADAFAAFGIDRSAATWQAGKLRDVDAPLFDDIEPKIEALHLPTMPPLRQTIRDYATTGLTLRTHPIAFIRKRLDADGVVTADQLADAERFPTGRNVSVAGLCLCRQRPGSANGITFMTLEDETGCSNLVVYANVFARHQRVARHATALRVKGRIDRQGQVVHVIAYGFASLDDDLTGLQQNARNFH